MIVHDIRNHPDPSGITKEDQVVAGAVWQVLRLATPTPTPLVVVPDFLNYARLLNTGQGSAMLSLAGGWSRVLTASMHVVPLVIAHPLRAATQDFWLVAEALARFDMALTRRLSEPILCLHPYLTDFALVFDQGDFVHRFARAAQRIGPWGLWTQQSTLALSACARWGLAPDFLVLLVSPQIHAGAAALRQARENKLFAGTKILADITTYPLEIQQTPNNLFGDPACVDGLIKTVP